MAPLNNQPLDLRFMGALRLRKPDSWSAGRICQKTCILLASARKAKRTDGCRSISKIGFSAVAQSTIVRIVVTPNKRPLIFVESPQCSVSGSLRWSACRIQGFNSFEVVCLRQEADQLKVKHTD